MWKRLDRVRVLPVVIALASLSLAVKVSTAIPELRAVVGGSLTIAGAHAKEASEAGQRPGQIPAERSQPAAPPGGQAAASGTAGPSPAPHPASETGSPAGAAKTAPAASPAAAAKPFAIPVDPQPSFSESEIEVLQKLAERRQVLDARAREIAEQTTLLQAAEMRIDQKVAELKELQAALEQLIKTYQNQEDEKLQSLVKIYENMKAKDAARIFEELEMDTLLLVAERMKERSLAPVMALMNPAKAKAMTVELARQRRLPESSDAATPGSS
jgi:flagellar motility protein MotE (MotC chaperone)